MRVHGDAGDHGVRLDLFFTTRRPLPTKPDHYVTVSEVLARPVEEPTRMVATDADGRRNTITAEPGGFILQHADGTLRYATAESFARRYEPTGED
jgi:hypothetical protein